MPMYLCLGGRERCRLTFFKLQVTMLKVGVYLYFNLQWKNMGWKGVATWTALHMMKDKYYFPKIWIHLYVCRLCLCIHTYLWYVLGLSANVFPTVVIVLKVHMLLNFQCKDSPLPMSLMSLNQLLCLGGHEASTSTPMRNHSGELIAEAKTWKFRPQLHLTQNRGHL